LFDIKNEPDPYYKPPKVYHADFAEQARNRKRQEEIERKEMLGLTNSAEKIRALEK
jgi:hypothetical protein